MIKYMDKFFFSFCNLEDRLLVLTFEADFLLAINSNYRIIDWLKWT